MKVAFFISDHGYGHITRNLPIARELIARGHEVAIVTGMEQAKVAKPYLNNVPDTSFCVCETDAGLVVYPGTLKIDRQSTIDKIESHLQQWPRLISSAPDADVYVVDIVPWALIAAKERGIRSILITNFTWVEQYLPFASLKTVEKYKSAYRLADKVIYYELANQAVRDMLGKGADIGLVCRPFNAEKVKQIKEQHQRPVVFMSLGRSNTGLNFEIDVSGLPYDFIVTSSLNVKGDNVQRLDVSVENTQDYLKASDICIAKAGWSTVAEALLAGVKLVLVNRSDTPEDTMTIDILKTRGDAVSVTVDDLKNFENIISNVLNKKWNIKQYDNNYTKIADLICEGKTDAKMTKLRNSR